MTTRYKMIAGLDRAVEKAIAELSDLDIGKDQEAYEFWADRVGDLTTRLGTPWSNPGDVTHSEHLAVRLMDAFYKAIGPEPIVETDAEYVTRMQEDAEMERWDYRNDPTHEP